MKLLIYNLYENCAKNINSRQRKISLQKYFHKLVGMLPPSEYSETGYTYNVHVDGDSVTFDDSVDLKIILPESLGEFETKMRVRISEGMIYFDDQDISYGFEKLSIKI